MEVLLSSETSVSTYQSTRRNIPEDLNLHREQGCANTHKNDKQQRVSHISVTLRENLRIADLFFSIGCFCYLRFITLAYDLGAAFYIKVF
jgi:hypothetical protein